MDGEVGRWKRGRDWRRGGRETWLVEKINERYYLNEIKKKKIKSNNKNICQMYLNSELKF